MGMLDVEDGYVVIQLPESDRYMSMMIYEYAFSCQMGMYRGYVVVS